MSDASLPGGGILLLLRDLFRRSTNIPLCLRRVGLGFATLVSQGTPKLELLQSRRRRPLLSP